MKGLLSAVAMVAGLAVAVPAWAQTSEQLNQEELSRMYAGAPAPVAPAPAYYPAPYPYPYPYPGYAAYPYYYPYPYYGGGVGIVIGGRCCFFHGGFRGGGFHGGGHGGGGHHR